MIAENKFAGNNYIVQLTELSVGHMPTARQGTENYKYLPH